MSVKRFISDTRGNITFVLAVSFVGLMVTIGVAVDYSSSIVLQSNLQAAADNAVLSGARELRLGNANESVVLATTKNHLASQLDSVRTPYSFNGVVAADRKSLSIEVSAASSGGFGAAIGLPQTVVTVKAQAAIKGGAPICLVGLDLTAPATLDLEKMAKVQANACAVYSNSKATNGIQSLDASGLTSAFTCSAGGYKTVGGSLAPIPDTDCPVFPDPLSSRLPPSVGACDPAKQSLRISADTYLTPGVYCGGLTIANAVIVTLQPGIYVIKDGPISIKNGGRIQGAEVGLYFTGPTAGLDLKKFSGLSLTAPKSGPMAGLIIWQDRTSPEATFEVSSDDASMLLGTIYTPNGILYLGGDKPVAQNSAFTIVIAKRVVMNAGPTLVLNSNYSAVDTPVPNGVGSMTNELFLRR